jgi:hypothetical protein
MAKLVFEMNQSPDGYVDHLEFRPSPALFRHFIEQVRGLTGSGTLQQKRTMEAWAAARITPPALQRMRNKCLQRSDSLVI